MRLVVLGANGQLGWELGRSLAPLGETTMLSRRAADGACVDLERPDELSRTLERLQPHVIANAAAYTDVDGADREPERARRVNGEAPAVIAAVAARLNALLVHYSTDYVFDGGGSAPWREDDAKHPLNVYGRTKLEGERAIRDSGCRHLIFRTQWLYSLRGTGFVRAVLQAALDGERLEVVEDQIGAPTGAELVADVTAHAVRAADAGEAILGTYHLAARGETSRYGWACRAVEQARRAGWPVSGASDPLPVPTTDAPARARRPLNARLDVSRLESAFALRLPGWGEGVDRLVAELGAGITMTAARRSA